MKAWKGTQLISTNIPTIFRFPSSIFFRLDYPLLSILKPSGHLLTTERAAQSCPNDHGYILF
jgi:hypothetical protein